MFSLSGKVNIQIPFSLCRGHPERVLRYIRNRNQSYYFRGLHITDFDDLLDFKSALSLPLITAPEVTGKKLESP